MLVRAHGEAAIVRACGLLDTVALVALEPSLLDAAANLGDAMLRSFDAVHVATVLLLGEDVRELITYDRRMGEAARALGLPVVAPT